LTPYWLATVTVCGEPTLPAYIDTVADDPASTVVKTLCGTLKYTITLAPGCKEIGPEACCKQSTWFEELDPIKFIMNAPVLAGVAMLLLGHVVAESWPALPR